jgi:hypothetical protein
VPWRRAPARSCCRSGRRRNNARNPCPALPEGPRLGTASPGAMWWAGTGSNRRPCGFQPGAAHPRPFGVVHLSRILPGQQGSSRACHSGWFGSVRLGPDQLGRTTAESRRGDMGEAYLLVGAAAHRVADLASARQTPAGCPRQASPAGNRLARGSPGGVWARDIPLCRRAVPGHWHGDPRRLTCSNHARDGGRPSEEARGGSCRLDRPTPCLQSRFGPARHLRWQGTAQVKAAVALPVIVRWGPVRTAPNGTVVARPVRAPVLRDQGPDRPAAHGKADQGVEPNSRVLVGHL